MDKDILALTKELVAALVCQEACGCTKAHHPDCAIGLAKELDRRIINMEIEKGHAPAEPTEG